MAAMESLAMPGLELWFGWMLGAVMGGDGRVDPGVGAGVLRSPLAIEGNPATTDGGMLGSRGIWNIAVRREEGPWL